MDDIIDFSMHLSGTATEVKMVVNWMRSNLPWLENEPRSGDMGVLRYQTTVSSDWGDGEFEMLSQLSEMLPEARLVIAYKMIRGMVMGVMVIENGERKNMRWNWKADPLFLRWKSDEQCLMRSELVDRGITTESPEWHDWHRDRENELAEILDDELEKKFRRAW